jgi:hypothetical protein
MPLGLNADHRSNRLLAALEPEDFACLEPHLELVILTHKHVLFDMGAAVSHAYFPHSAIVSLVNVMEDGANLEVGVFGCEGVLGLLSAMASRKAFGRYIVQMPGTASRIAFERMKAAQNARPKLRQLILNLRGGPAGPDLPDGGLQCHSSCGSAAAAGSLPCMTGRIRTPCR